MAGLSGIVKKISDLVTGTPADDDCFIFGKTDLKKITLAKLKDALGITSINSALLCEKFAYDTTGENFNKNLLLIDTNNTEAIVNQRSFFDITDSTRGDYLNIPSAMPSEGVVIGYREVYVKSASHCLVKITECFPVSGRQYFNFYNSGNWDGWKVIQP